MIGISIKPGIGIGDGLQFSSLPENYFNATGERLIDVSEPWFFDHNPFVARGSSPHRVQELWNFSPTKYQWPKIKDRSQEVYLSNAEVWASLLGVPVTLNRPRLYRYEDFPFAERTRVLLHVEGRSHGRMPDKVIDHILKKYGGCDLYQIGPVSDIRGVPRIATKDLWELSKVISSARILIGVDSGPAWIAACYPDVVVKKLRMKPTTEQLAKWVPLACNNVHSFWDDRCHQVFNPSDDDIGFTSSFRKI